MTIDLHRPGQLRSIALHRAARVDRGFTVADSVALRCAYRGF